MLGPGHNGPGDWNTVCPIHMIRARPIKILDFVPFYVWMVLENSFLEFVFEIFCKTEKKNFDRRVPLWKKDWGYQKTFLFTKRKSFIFLWAKILFDILNLFSKGGTLLSKIFFPVLQKTSKTNYKNEISRTIQT